MESKAITFENLPKMIGELFNLVENINNKLSSVNNPKKEDELLTRKQVANLLKVSLNTVSNHVKDGKLKPYKMGKGQRVLFSKDEVLKNLFNSNTKEL